MEENKNQKEKKRWGCWTLIVIITALSFVVGAAKKSAHLTMSRRALEGESFLDNYTPEQAQADLSSSSVSGIGSAAITFIILFIILSIIKNNSGDKK